jgi:signal transduction histidine kinase
MELADRPEAAALIDQILQAEIRAAELTRSLLTFCRKSELKLTPVSLNQTVEGLQKTLIRIIRDGIAFNLDLAECPLVARADKGQIEQVLINLAVNARDAMPHGGTLLFATREVTITGDEAVGNGTLPPGRYAQITVTDSGSGMDKKTMEYIFDPFFTTKEAGKGTGLGLAIVHGIIKNHGGKVSVQSEPGKGTTFTIHLPLLEEAEMDGASATA